MERTHVVAFCIFMDTFIHTSDVEWGSICLFLQTDIREQTKNVKTTSVNIDRSVTLLFISVDLHLTIYKCITLKVVCLRWCKSHFLQQQINILFINKQFDMISLLKTKKGNPPDNKIGRNWSHKKSRL